MKKDIKISDSLERDKTAKRLKILIVIVPYIDIYSFVYGFYGFRDKQPSIFPWTIKETWNEMKMATFHVITTDEVRFSYKKSRYSWWRKHANLYS